MPFTASHAVVALPFIRTPLPYGAVAVGSMTPDLPLFFPWGLSYGTTHGFPSLLLTSLPLAVFLYLVWRVLLRPAASTLLPRPIGERLPPTWRTIRRMPSREVLFTGVALLLGVITHVFWDGFTHPSRFGSAVIPALGQLWGPFDGTQWLQYVSSAAGLVVLGIAGALYLRRTAPVAIQTTPWLRTAYWSSLVLAAIVGVITATAMLGLPTNTRAAKLFAFEAGTLAGALMLVATAVAAGSVLVLRRESAHASTNHPRTGVRSQRR